MAALSRYESNLRIIGLPAIILSVFSCRFNGTIPKKSRFVQYDILVEWNEKGENMSKNYLVDAMYDQDAIGISSFSEEVLTKEQMSILKTQIATAITESSYSLTISEEMRFSRDKYTFDNGLILIYEELKEKRGWHTYQKFYIFDGMLFKIYYWDANGLEKNSKDFKMPHIVNLFDIERQYYRDPEKNNRLLKMARLSMSSQTFLEREMPYLVA